MRAYMGTLLLLGEVVEEFTSFHFLGLETSVAVVVACLWCLDPHPRFGVVVFVGAKSLS
jgi:hypothetical protein